MKTYLHNNGWSLALSVCTDHFSVFYAYMLFISKTENVGVSSDILRPEYLFNLRCVT